MVAQVEVSPADVKLLREYIQDNYEPGDHLDAVRISSETGIAVKGIIVMFEERGQAILASGLTEEGETVRIYKARGDRLYEEAKPLSEYREIFDDEPLLRYAKQNNPKGRHQPPNEERRWS